MSRAPKNPMDKAYVKDDGMGRLSLLVGLSAYPEPGKYHTFVDLTLKAGTTFDEACALAREINSKLAHVALETR